MSILSSLQTWYAQQCNGKWEHHSGVNVTTLDNPGWSMTIDIDGTSLDRSQFVRRSESRSESDWYACRVENGQFLAAR